MSFRILTTTVFALCASGASSSSHPSFTSTPWTRGVSPASSVPTALQLQGGASRFSMQRKQAPSRPAAAVEAVAAAAAEREKLYEAYNLLHTLGKDFKVDIQPPSVLVVGHQTAGKSALIEALMGFQFNNVGGGTKTRRPIALHMRYNPDCHQPVCYLTNDITGQEQQMTLEQIQEYITSENRRLEADASRGFDSREIVVRVEYRFCPNMVMVDTPGLISGGRAGGRAGRGADGRPLNGHEKALQQASREAESLVLAKMKSPEYIILCIEDTTDWKHATCRALVEQADPHLKRTVLVNTKLDAKLLQFAEGADVEDFIRAPIVRQLHPHLAGGPFYTSVPAGRVGARAADRFSSNEDFIRGLRRRERDDADLVEDKCGEGAAAALEAQLGVRRLRRFLEERVEKCYRQNVATIVPALQGALKRNEDAQAKCRTDLAALSTDSLKATANQYREHFSKAVQDCIQGTISAPPDYFGQTLEEEQLGGGAFYSCASHGVATEMSGGGEGLDEEAWARLRERELGLNFASAKLYGGSQYHRALREFALAVQHMQLPDVTSDEIANAAGISDVHDGTNFMRAACVIAVEKAQVSFDPLVGALSVRARHVMKRLFPIVMHMLDAKGVNLDAQVHGKLATGGAGGSAAESAVASAAHAAFADAVEGIFNEFIELALSECLKKCQDDLTGMTNFVTWDLNERGSLAVQDSLPSKEMVNIYALTMKKKKRGGAKALRRQDEGDGGYPHEDEEERGDENNGEEAEEAPRRRYSSRRRSSRRHKAKSTRGGSTIVEEWEAANGADGDRWEEEEARRSGGGRRAATGRGSGHRDLVASPGQQMAAATSGQRSEAMDVMALMEQVACMRDGDRATNVVSHLVQHIVRAWQMSFAQNVAMKFNCFFLMPFLQEFPFYLRTRLDKLYGTDLKHLFDLTEARGHLERRLEVLQLESAAHKRLQEKFEAVNRQLGRAAAGTHAAAEAEAADLADELAAAAAAAAAAEVAAAEAAAAVPAVETTGGSNDAQAPDPSAAEYYDDDDDGGLLDDAGGEWWLDDDDAE